MTQQTVIDAQDAISEYMTERLMKREDIGVNEAIEMLISSKTYALLQDKDSDQYAKSPEYMWMKLQQELDGDMVSWMKE